MAAGSKPLAGRRVLVTRPRQSSSELHDRLRDLGATVIDMPLLSIEPPESYLEIDAALRRLSDFAWMVFASRAAVDAVLSRLRMLHLSLPADLRVAAVGPSTAQRLTDAGLRVDLVPEVATARALATEIAAQGVAGSRILFPCGDRSRPELVEYPEAAGARVQRVVVYRTVDVRPDTATDLQHTVQSVDVVALASPSAVDALLGSLGDVEALRHLRLVCIGPSTAQALRAAGLEPTAVAEPHTAAGLADAIASLYTE